MSRAQRHALVESENPITAPAVRMSGSWVFVYRLSEEDCVIMARIGQKYLAHTLQPIGARWAAWLAIRGHLVNLNRAQSGGEADAANRTGGDLLATKDAQADLGDKVYGCLLGRLAIGRVNQGRYPNVTPAFCGVSSTPRWASGDERASSSLETTDGVSHAARVT
jgi:hypothetical protein